MRFRGIILFLCLFVSCKSEKISGYKVFHQKPVVVIDSLFMQMPGMIYFVDDKIIIEDALATESFYNIYDSSGNFIKKIASLGNSSVEFSMPNFTLLSNDDIVISDLNRGNAVLYEKGVDTISQYTGLSSELLKKSSLLHICDDTFVAINNSFKREGVEGLFNVYENNTLVKSFGKFPVDEKFTNYFDMYQGSLTYNRDNKTLLFFSYKIPYYAIYKYNDSDFELVKEEKYAKFDCLLKGDNLVVQNVEVPPITEVALLKDYIVTLGNTAEDLKQIPEKSVQGRDFSQLPRSLFVYDYNYNLLRVISIDTPTLRVASNLGSNLLYFVNYVDYEFNLSKLDI